jgi:hypothetical protein
MKQFGLAVSVLLVAVSVFLCSRIISNSLSNQNYNNDYAELNNIRYGLLSVAEWKRQIKTILADEIDRLDLTGQDAKVLRKNIEAHLHELVDKVYNQVREENSKSPAGWVKQSFINVFINPEAIKKGIPEYTDAIFREITNSRTKSQIKSILNKQLERYSEKTFGAQDDSQVSTILIRTNAPDIASARGKLKAAISEKRALIAKDAIVLAIIAIIIFSFPVLSRGGVAPSMYILLVSMLVILLIAGVTTPMINMEAKISHLRFFLLGHDIYFDDQVLYFQSKSVLDVFWLLINYKDVLMKFVAVLIITFSIIFPMLKLLASMAYYYDYCGARKNVVVKFFTFNSGKWSMADVVVVSIFMAYIGASGIIGSQLAAISRSSPELAILTMNGTSLQPGYYLFLAYTMLAMVLSEYFAKMPNKFV